MTDYMRTYDDWKCHDSDREGEEEEYWDGRCIWCTRNRHSKCKGGDCACFREHSPVFHPKREGKLKLKMEQR